jgi:peptide deformylase
MAILNILKAGESDILSNKAVDLTKADVLSSKIQTLIEDMIDTLHDSGGLGLAANQVGSDANLCVFKVPGERGYRVLINPTITAKKNRFNSKGEGCLSLPGRRFNVKRWKKIEVSGVDKDGEVIEFETKSKHLAKIIQHEIDHLQGITLLDKGKEV